MTPTLLTDNKMIGLVHRARSQAGHEDLEERDIVHLRRHQLYELQRVAIEDIQIQLPSKRPADKAPARTSLESGGSPIVLDGVWMTPWYGDSQIQAAQANGETHVLAYVGRFPRLDRSYIPSPQERQAREAANKLHSHLRTMITWRTPKDPNPVNRVPKIDYLLRLAEKAHVEFMDEGGVSLLGAAVEAFQQKPYRDLVEPVLGCLLRRGASPDRSTRSCSKETHTYTPFQWILLEYHPSPNMLDPEHPFPEHIWKMFQPHLDLSLLKNQKIIGQWLEVVRDDPLQGAANNLQAMLHEAALKTTLPQEPSIHPKVRF